MNRWLVFITALALVGSIAVSGPSSTKADGTLSKAETLPPPLVRSGSYSAYTLRDAVKVGANMIANPSRLTNVSWGKVYSPTEIDVSDSRVAAAISVGVSTGQLGVASKTASGNLLVSPSDEIQPTDRTKNRIIEICNSNQNTNPSIKFTPTEECKAAISDWLTKINSSNSKVIASSPNLEIGVAEGTVISWEPKEPVRIGSIRINKTPQQ